VELVPSTAKSELLQALLVVLLGFIHVAIYIFVLGFVVISGGIYMPLGLALGVLELAGSRKVPATLAVLRTWLLAVGVLTIVLTLVSLAYVLTAPW
jgi:hypothetical protein